MKDEYLLGYKGYQFIDAGTVNRPYIPLHVSDYKKSLSNVIFHPWDGDSDEEMIDKYLSDIFRYKIVGLECENGTVIVYILGEETTKLKNKKEFEEKYFTEAL